MDILNDELEERQLRVIKSEKNSYDQEVFVQPKVTMEVNGEDVQTNAGRWEVVGVISDINSNRNIHSELICADALKSQDSGNVDDPPTITDGGTVYRVVQLTADEGRTDGQTQIVTASAALVGGQQVTQAIIANPFTTGNGNSSPGSEGPFYVMMSPQDVLQSGQRAIAPRTGPYSPTKLEGARTARDERRRATHNEVERRRRDKINNWIVKLSKIVPDCSSDCTKQGQFYSQSKGGILAKACDYIHELRTSCGRLPDILKENERLNVDADNLRLQIEELKSENSALRAHLQQQGVVTNMGNS